MNDEKHHLYRRGKIYWLCIIVSGPRGKKRCRVSLGTTDVRRAMRERDRYIDPIRGVSLARRLRAVATSVEVAEADNAIKLKTDGTGSRKATVSVDNIVDRFIKGKDKSGTSAGSVDMYVRCIAAIRVFLFPRTILEAVRADWDRFVDKMRMCPKKNWLRSESIRTENNPAERLKDKSVSNVINAVMAFYAWLEKEEYLDRSPFRSVEMIAVKDATKRKAPPQDVAQRLRAIEAPDGSGIDRGEWRLFVELISRTGMRLGECASLEIEKLSLNDPIPWFFARNEKQGKGQTNRSEKAIPVPSVCLEMLRHQVSLRKGEKYVFGTVGYYRGVSKQGIAFETFGKRIGKVWIPIARVVWPRMDFHTWRHYCSIHVNRRFPQEVSMRLLGHSPGIRAINEIYNERNLEQLRDAVESIP